MLRLLRPFHFFSSNFLRPFPFRFPAPLWKIFRPVAPRRLLPPIPD